jgi:hypothetical protein
MIDRQALKIVVECDTCSDVIESDEREDWETFWPRARRDGWKSKKIAGEWVHGCNRCGVE